MSVYILGISCFYHDSSAVLLKDGEIMSAVQEERFTRIKYDSSFPINSILYCLRSNNIDLRDIKAIIYYEKPLLTFERLLETYLAVAPHGMRSFIAAMKVWVKQKLFLKSELKKQFKNIQIKFENHKKPQIPQLLFSEHHQSHAAAAFFPSPFKNAVILCMDGVGEWATTSAWIGNGNKIKPLWEISFPHSIGLLYSAFTYYCGFKVNSGEYKLMGLAPYGKPIFKNKIKENLIDIKEDGTFRLDMSYFKFHRGFRMISKKFYKLFGSKPRGKNDQINQFHMDLAASIQSVTEEIVLKLAKSLALETGEKNICLAGGVALNCVANGKLLNKKIYDQIWIQPSSGDSGSALGAAYIAWHEYFNKSRNINLDDSMKGAYLGCSFSNKEIISYLRKIKAVFQSIEDEDLFKKLAKLIDDGNVIGWFSGPMEFGPRALGGRSIVADPRKKNMQKLINSKIKFREGFRPFAPSILEEEVSTQFDLKVKSPYMLFVTKVKNSFHLPIKNNNIEGFDKLNLDYSLLPAITHVDYSARVQTVKFQTNPRFYNLIKAFKELTNCSSIINTSFNVRGEPIVCSPQDAYRCFMRTNMDILVLENQILFKNQQLNNQSVEFWNQKFDMD